MWRTVWRSGAPWCAVGSSDRPVAVRRCPACGGALVRHCALGPEGHDVVGDVGASRTCRWLRCVRCHVFGDPALDRWSPPLLSDR